MPERSLQTDTHNLYPFGPDVLRTDEIQHPVTHSYPAWGGRVHLVASRALAQRNMGLVLSDLGPLCTPAYPNSNFFFIYFYNCIFYLCPLSFQLWVLKGSEYILFSTWQIVNRIHFCCWSSGLITLGSRLRSDSACLSDADYGINFPLEDRSLQMWARTHIHVMRNLPSTVQGIQDHSWP